MKRTRLVGSKKTSQVSLLGSSDQRQLNSIRRITKLDASLAKVFAEPVLDANGETIYWYTDLPGPIFPYEELSSSDKQFVEESWEAVCQKLKGFTESLNAADRVILENVVETPGVEALHLVGRELLVTDWSSVRVGYRPKNKNIGIELDPKTIVQNLKSDHEYLNDEPHIQPNTKDLESVFPEPSSSLVFDPNRLDQPHQAPGDDKTISHITDAKTGFFYSLWFWGSLFFFLCCLNWFLLIGACGVDGVHFLNFCR